MTAATGLALLGMLAGCAGSTTGSDGVSAWALTGGSEQMFRTSFEAWNDEHPDEQIAAEWFANDAFKEKIRTAVGSGNGPTLIYSWAGGTLADYVANDKVADISEDMASLLDRIIPSVAANGQIDGKTYAVPNTQSQPVILYYNADVLKAAGIEEPPSTFDELLDAVEALKSDGVTPIALAGGSAWTELMWMEYLLDRVGGPEVFQRVLDGEQGAWSDPAVVEAAGLVRELVDAGAFGDAFGSIVADQNADTALVQTGKAAFVLQGSWVYPNFLKDAPDFVSSGALGYTTFPAVTGGEGDPANIVGNPSNFWSVSATASESAKNTATEFLADSVLSDDAVAELLDLGTVPPVVGLEDAIASHDNADYLAFSYGMVRDAPSFQLSWDQALPAAQAQALLNNLSQLFLGQLTPEQFASSMDDTL